jgi:hypothetical protein
MHWSGNRRPRLRKWWRCERSAQRCSGGMSQTVRTKVASSVRPHFSCTRCVEAGRVSRLTPGRRSVAGRIGRCSNPPPQFGQTFSNTVSTHWAQNVHSKLQMRASIAFGGRSLSQYSQLGRSCSIADLILPVALSRTTSPLQQASRCRPVHPADAGVSGLAA